MAASGQSIKLLSKDPVNSAPTNLHSVLLLSVKQFRIASNASVRVACGHAEVLSSSSLSTSCKLLQMTKVLDSKTQELQIYMKRLVRQNEQFLFTFQDVS